MPKEMAATALGAGGSSGGAAAVADPEPVAPEQELGGTEAPQPDSPAGDAEGAPGSDQPGQTRLQDTPEYQERRKAQSKALEDALAQLLPERGPEGGPSQPRVAPPQATATPDIPLKVLPSGERVLDIPLPIGYAEIEAAFQANKNDKVDDRTAFHQAFGGLFMQYHEALTRRLTGLLPGITNSTVRALQNRTQQVKAVEQVRGQIENYWKTMAPAIPAKHLWVYAQEAARAIPGQTRQHVARQAEYCLARALEEFGDRFAGPAPNTDTTRAQDAMLRPGEGSGRAPVRSTGVRGANLAEQMKSAFGGLRR